MESLLPVFLLLLLTEKQAAAFLTRSVSSLRRGRKDGTGPDFLRIGRSIRYPKAQLEAYIAAHLRGTTREVSLN